MSSPAPLADIGDELTGTIVAVRIDDLDPDTAVIDLGTDAGIVVRGRGPLAGLVEGERVRLLGAWRDRPGAQRIFEARAYERLPLSADRAEILASLDGIPPAVRRRVATAFGAGAGRVIDHEPARLITDAGLDPAAADALRAAWSDRRALVELVRIVAPAGWPIELARQLHDATAGEAVTTVRTDPYALVGVGDVRFAHADALAAHLGVARDDDRRLAAGARAVVASAQHRDGHVHLSRRAVVVATARLLEVDALLASSGLDAAVAAGWLATDHLAGTTVVSTPQAIAVEHRLVAGIARLVQAPEPPAWSDVESDRWVSGLPPSQRVAVSRAVTHPVSIVTATAGRGAVSVVAGIARLADAAGSGVVVCAPSPGAAAYLAEQLGRSVRHVAELVARGRPAARPDAEVVIALGAEHVEVQLLAGLVDTIADRSRLVLVGDPQQLPTAAPGAVLWDLVACGQLPVTDLADVDGGPADRRLITLAQEVLAGAVGALPPAADDVFLAAEPRADAIVGRVVRAVTDRIPTHLDVDPTGVAVLAPAAGPVGVDVMTSALAAARRPSGTPVGATVSTIEAAVGGSWPVVVLVCDASHRSELSRRALYTAVTRAQRALIIVGQPEVVREAATHDRRVDRHTGVAWLLRSKLDPGTERGHRAAAASVVPSVDRRTSPP